MKGYLYFHQGWTDIICQLSLIDYYLNKYDELKVIMRSDSKPIVDFYVKNKNVIVNYIETDNGREINNSHLHDIGIEYDILFHGQHDIHRKDTYRNSCSGENPKGYFFFIEAFYGCYDIDYTQRVESFIVERDMDQEEKKYQEFIKTNGDKYILYHDDENNHINGTHHISTKIKFDNRIEGYKYINLNRSSRVLFDYIKILQNAKEIHLIDSIWGSFCYQMDAKYEIFKDKTIYLYPMRGHDRMFTFPKKIENWIIKNK